MFVHSQALKNGEAAVPDGSQRPGRPAQPPAADLVEQGWWPVSTSVDHVVVETSQRVTADLRRQVRRWFPDHRITFTTVSVAALQDKQLLGYSDALADHIAEDFTRRHPGYAAKTGVAAWQRVLAVTAAVVVATSLVFVPRVLMLVLVVASSMVTLTMAALSTAGLMAHRASRPSTGRFRRDGAAARHLAPAAHSSGRVTGSAGPRLIRGDRPRLEGDALPRYTVLVPAYHEEAVIGDLVRCMHALDYPEDKLEVLILVERRDLATKAAIRAALPKPFVRIVELPPGAPQTKPRSCNAGLLLATGNLVVIYDAEDRPEPDQLRKAAAQFDHSGPDLACVQAKLLVANGNQNFISQQFALEYAMRYNLTVPGLATLGMPIPLGGTSNHFRADALRQLGGWDAWNVTEDADLGMRCQAMGYRVDVVDSITWGDSTTTVNAWIKQRTRWLKGFLLTALVHSRRPLATARRFHLAGLLTLVVVVAGTPLTYLAQSLAFVVWASRWHGLTGLEVPHTSALCLGLLVLGLLATITLQGISVLRRAGGRLLPVVTPLLPVYWVMQWVASWRALAQLVTAPFNWEKTPHGTAELQPTPSADVILVPIQPAQLEQLESTDRVAA